MDEEPESRGLSQGQLPYDHIFTLEPVVPVEWYSRAQLEYLAEKIRTSQSIDGLLLPIPKLAMNLSRPSPAAVEDQGTKRHDTTWLLKSRANTPMDNFLDGDLSWPLQIASPPLISKDQSSSNDIADEESELHRLTASKRDRHPAAPSGNHHFAKLDLSAVQVVTLVLENLVGIVAREEDDRLEVFNFAPPGAIVADTPQKSHPAPEVSAGAVRSEIHEAPATSELPSGDNNVSRPHQDTDKTRQQQASPRSSETAEDAATHKPNLVNLEESEEPCEGPAYEPKPQRFLRKKEPLEQGGPENDIVIRLHESDGLVEHPESLKPMIQRMFKQLVVIVSSESKTLYRDFHHPSTLDDNFKLMKLEPTKIKEIISKLNIASKRPQPRVPRAGEEPQDDALIDNAEEPLGIKVPDDEDEDTMRLKKELFDLIFEKDYDDTSLKEIIESAYLKLLLLERTQCKLLNEKRRLTEQRRNLSHELAKLQKSRQRQEKRSENSQTNLPRKRKLIEMQVPQAVIRTRIVAAAPRHAKTITDSANKHGMALTPGTLLRVVQGRFDGHPAQARSFTVVPQVSRAGLSPGDLITANPLGKTVNHSLLPTFTPDPNSDHLRSEASGVCGLPQSAAPTPANLAPTVVTVASNSNPSSHVFANHARLIRVDPNAQMSPGSSTTAVHVGFPHGMVRSGHSGSDVDPSPVNGHLQARQLIQVPSYAFPVSKPSVITRAPNSRVVMVTPAQFSALQSQVQQRRPIRIQNASMSGGGEPGPTTVVHHLQRYPEEFATAPPGAAANLKPHLVAPIAFTEHRVSNVHSNEPTVIVNPSLNFQVVRPQSTIAPRFFTVRQPYIMRPPGPSN